MIKTVHKIALASVALFAGGVIVTQSASADTVVGIPTVQLPNKTVTVEQVTYSYDLSDKQVDALVKQAQNQAVVKLTTNDDRTVTTVDALKTSTADKRYDHFVEKSEKARKADEKRTLQNLQTAKLIIVGVGLTMIAITGIALAVELRRKSKH